jgi:hypothetical protein
MNGGRPVENPGHAEQPLARREALLFLPLA